MEGDAHSLGLVKQAEMGGDQQSLYGESSDLWILWFLISSTSFSSLRVVIPVSSFQ